MRKDRYAQSVALLLTGLLICPAATVAVHARCLAAAHPCAPAPAILACCCVTAADADQFSLTAGSVVVHGSAAGEATLGRAFATDPRLTLTAGPRPAPAPPIDRLALFSRLLI